mmetsp:Transcript_11721/g.22179  ORF Transcript_11721/g.22179 Transcript_11721/m.22179 type:complete len:100 (+) Transcript_11721:1063-1362(+)
MIENLKGKFNRSQNMAANKKTPPIRLKSGLLAPHRPPIRAPTNDGPLNPLLSLQNRKFERDLRQIARHIANTSYHRHQIDRRVAHKNENNNNSSHLSQF